MAKNKNHCPRHATLGAQSSLKGWFSTVAAQPPTGEAAASFDVLLCGIDSLEPSMGDLNRDLFRRALERIDTSMSTSSPQEGPQEGQTGLDAAEQKDKLGTENDTRATLHMPKGLMGHAKDYDSSIESVSESSEFALHTLPVRRSSTGAAADPDLRANIVIGLGIEFLAHLPPRKLPDIADWVYDVGPVDAVLVLYF